MDFTGYEELLREIAFQADIETLGALLKTGKTVWGVLRDGDMRELYHKHIKIVEVRNDSHDYYSYDHIRRDTEKPHGYSYEKHGSRSECGNYRNGELHGERKYYGKWGLREVDNWYRGIRHGEYCTYDIDGVIETSGYFNMGEVEIQRLYKEGKLIYESTYSDDYEVMKTWKDETLVSEEKFYKGRHHGWQIYYLRGKRRLYRKGKFRCSKRN